MYGQRTGNNSTTIILVLIAIGLYFTMPKSVTFKVEKSVAIPVVATLLGVSVLRNLRF
jgi:hypothetical protein